MARAPHSHRTRAEVSSSAPHCIQNRLSISLVSGCYVQTSQDYLSYSDRILVPWEICEMYWSPIAVF